MYIYFIQVQITRLVKIGKTRDPKQRLATIQAHSPEKIKLLKIIDANRDDEINLHKQFASVRSHGEWFYPLRGLMAYISGLKNARNPKRQKSLDDVLQIRVPTLRDQVLAVFTDSGEKSTLEILESVEAHPVSVKKEIKKACDAGQILKVRHSTYAEV